MLFFNNPLIIFTIPSAMVSKSFVLHGLQHTNAKEHSMHVWGLHVMKQHRSGRA
ncbi:unnamed protein product [Haemonchus placei]|uniref:Uncharacterized protein n=1 Tax=Haemonchus placei TaxID=6290 RepID=A0A0N4XB14_HAEPC|nr:unnamed protein product [Haemonchus placei]